MSRSLSLLINSGQKDGKKKDEHRELDVSELFAEQIDRRMEKKIQKTVGSVSQPDSHGYSRFDQTPGLLSGVTNTKPKLSDKDQEEIERQKALEEEKRIRKRYEQEAEMTRQANLERLRQENQQKQREMERAQEIERKKQEKNSKNTGQSSQKQQRAAGYNPLAPIDPTPEHPDSLYRPTDPAQDNRFVFSLKLPQTPNPKPPQQKPKQASNYNPLQVPTDQRSLR